MIRAPLNVIPTWNVFMMQTNVALDRIQGCVDEDKVDGRVSGLKEDTEENSGREGLGIINGCSSGMRSKRRATRARERLPGRVLQTQNRILPQPC